MKDLSFVTIEEIKQDLANKEYQIEDVLDFYLDRFAQHDKTIGSALEVFDMSYNGLTGDIPQSVQNLSFGAKPLHHQLSL